MERILAIEARRKLGIDLLDPIENISNLLQKKANISIIKKQLDNDISGICSKSDDGIMAVLINTNFSLGRQNFTIAHEYYHLMYDEKLYTYSTSKETKANTFASYFLMPKEALEYYLDKKGIPKKKDVLTPDNIIDISLYFRLSYLATIVRLEKIEKLLSKEKAEEYKKLNAQELARINGISTRLYTATKENFLAKTDYVNEVNKALLNEKITEGKYESLLLEGGFEDIVYGLNDDNDVEALDGRVEDYM